MTVQLMRGIHALLYNPNVSSQSLRAFHVREYEVAGLGGVETNHPPQFKTPKHSHTVPSFFLVLEGSLTQISNRHRRDLTAGNVVFVPPGEIHSEVFHAAGGRCFLVEFLPSWKDQLSSSRIRLERYLESNNDELPWLAKKLYKEFRCADDFSALAVEGLALEIMTGFCRQAQGTSVSRPSWMNKVLEQLHDRFSESIKLEELAKAAGVHPVHLARAFRRHYLCSLGHYQRRLRVEHACTLLLKSKLSLVEVALSAGFSDQAHFTRVFKKWTGTTPSEFRQIIR